MQTGDAGKLVEVASSVVRGSDRTVDWFSMPAPIGRDDDADFEPLAD